MTKKILPLLLCLCAVPAPAQDATIESIKGSVFILPRGDRPIPAQPGDKILFGDGVRTGAGSAAHVVLAGGQILLVRENSRLTLGGTTEHARVYFPRGEFLVGLTKIPSSRRSFRIATPAAVASARGTLFWGKTDRAKSAAFAALGGTVAVTAQGKTVRIGPGQRVVVALGAPPAPVERHPIAPSYLDTFRIVGFLRGLEALIDPAPR